ncbi:MAG: cellulase family glycosylhydrolase [Verrucomicrobia bacterium]|nr:cellulase family glycosylhydrolase [Verrucomicrobiota bacterium]
MKPIFLRSLAALAATFSLARAADLVPFPVDWKTSAHSPVDLSALLDAPAGRLGFITMKDGHFATADGRRLRFWGVNATGAGALPRQENADVLAAGLARRGVNCVRLHMLDSRWGGLFPRNANDTLSLDPAQLDRLDTFVAALKRRGIYVNLNLNVSRSYRPGDGVRDAELLGFAKSVTYFDERILALQRDYARQLLTHRNPYTGRTYADEPAVALVEFVNENSLIEAWFGARLEGKGTQKNPGTWADLPPSYAADLTAKFNTWLARHASAADLAAWRTQAGVAAAAPLPRLTSKEIAKADRARFHAEARFYLEVERDFFTGMAKFLRDELHVHALFAGNSDHGHSRTGYPQLSGTSLLDVVDSHTYWQHPNYLNDPATGKKLGYTIGNSPMVDDPLHSSVVELSRSAFAGKPFTVSEVNHPFPAEYATEGIPILAAYAALQDWDGIFWYTLLHADLADMNSSVAGHFDLAMDAGRLAQLAPGALLFLRGDVTAARSVLTRSYTREQVIDSIRLDPREHRPYFTPGFPLALPLTQAVRIASLDGPPTSAFPAVAAATPLRSETGELHWQFGEKRTGLVTIDTPRSQAATGFSGADRVQLRHLAVSATTPFAALTLSALDSAPIAQARRLLLTATARTANTDQTWNAKRNSTDAWGRASACTEPVRARVTLRGLAGAKRLTVTALDANDQPAAPSAAPLAPSADGTWALELNAPGAAPAITWVLEVVR